MGLVYADIELINGDDLSMVRRHLMDQDEVKKMTVHFFFFFCAYNLCINKVIQEQLKSEGVMSMLWFCPETANHFSEQFQWKIWIL